MIKYPFPHNFGTSQRYTPLNSKQIQELQKTIKNQLNHNIITKYEIIKINTELTKIQNKLIPYQKNPDFSTQLSIAYIAQALATNNEVLLRCNLLKRPYDPSETGILQDIKNIKVAIEAILPNPHDL